MAMTIYSENPTFDTSKHPRDKRDGQHWPSKIIFLVLLLLIGFGGLWLINNPHGNSAAQYVCRNSSTDVLTLVTSAECENGSILKAADLKGLPGANGEDGLNGIDGKNLLRVVDKLETQVVIQGEPGEPGTSGADGSDGVSISMEGSYATWDELLYTHPIGEPGDTYIVDGHLATWDWNLGSWIDVGHIQGPQGMQGEQGIQGEQGLAGIQGIQGVTGATGA
ncbi:MAG: hypothetical protein RL410_752, partial [Actinomycetota bacterium]